MNFEWLFDWTNVPAEKRPTRTNAMPLFPTPLPPERVTDAFLKNDVEIRIAEKVYEKPNPIDGKKTYIFAAIAIAGFIGRLFKVDVPEDQIRTVVQMISQEWGPVMEIIGILGTIWGRFKASQKHEKEVAVVKEVAREAVVETLVAKAVVAEVKADLHVKTVELAEVAKSIPTPKK